MKPRPLAVMVGFIAKSPIAGMTMYNFHYIAGLRELGYDVHYLEIMALPKECYDPVYDTFSDYPTFGLKVLRGALEADGPVSARWTLIDRDGKYHGCDRKALCAAVDKADFVLTIADPVWNEDLERCPRRAFLDGDPLFMQARMLEEGSPTALAVANYPTLFTYWTRQGAADTTVPSAGRDWVSTTPLVCTSMWDVAAPLGTGSVTTVMNWDGFKDVTLDGMTYGKKDRSLLSLIDLPSKTSHHLAIAIGGSPPEDELREKGWNLLNPLAVTGSRAAYTEFIAGSYADLGIAKHAYVTSRSGWFSDRSLCYLASGRPVLHQDTGFTDWLPTGEGVLAFSNVDEAADGLREIDTDYQRHARAAREIAETRFEARTVLATMLDQARFR